MRTVHLPPLARARVHCALLLGLLCACSPLELRAPEEEEEGAAAAALPEPDYIYGLHDPGGEHLMGSHKGWILFTVQCGDGPRDYRPWSDAGYGVLVRLNHGYGAAGTLPPQAEYGAFAARCAAYVRGSPGVHYWILGNETNLPREWPGNVDGRPDTGEPITVSRYVDAYLQAHAAIRAVRPDARLMPAPAGTWAPPWPAQGLPEGFIDYWVRILRAVGAERIQGLALHAYTHGCDPALVASEQRMAPPYENVRYHFRVYRDYLAALPPELRRKPVFITEANQNVECAAPGAPPRPAWPDADRGWVQRAYGEIDAWNRASSQKIRALVLFRWEMAPEGEWTYGISARPGVLRDFAAAVSAGYRWRGGGGVGNDAEVLAGESDVPATLGPGERREVRLRVRNRGGATWRAGTAHRLGAGDGNTLRWGDFACGGYERGPGDARASLCRDVPPGATHDFRFSVTSGAGGGRLAVRMVQDGVEWFGAAASFPIAAGGDRCPCRFGMDNFCHHAPRTPGCPMTFPGGYCDPDGDGGYGDADWVRGFGEYAAACR